MHFTSSWRKLVKKVRRQAGQSLRGSRSMLDPRRSFPLAIEQLEDRTLLSTYQWTGANFLTDTNWSDSANWTLLVGSGTIPNAVGDVAQFTGTPASSTATVDVAVTLGEIDFASSSS